MTNLIIELSKYALIILMALYTCMTCLSFRAKSVKLKDSLFVQMSVVMLTLHFVAYLVLYLKLEQEYLLYFYGCQVVFFLLSLILWRVIYPRMNRTLLSNLCMCLTISFVMLARIHYDRAVKQFLIAAISMAFSLIVPVLVRKWRFLAERANLYGIVGIVLLGAVLLLSVTTYGANLSITVAGVTIQPSEFVKLLFVFYTAGRLSRSVEFKEVAVTTVMAAVHVLILVASTDLGGALLYFVTYLVMLYVATKKSLYLFSGLLAGCTAGFAAFHLFSHVRVRVMAWSDPWSCIDAEGYQVTQSLFAIGTGGWLGMGLCQGMPSNIPFVEKDSMFSAISEELGGIFALCFLMLCISVFLTMFLTAMRLRNEFYRLAAIGFGTLYAFQVFLTVGGAIKLIPLTGVTLPLVSYGGSSLLSTMILFAIVQGMNLLLADEQKEEQAEKEREDEEEITISEIEYERKK